jgi:hypothetical protein
MQRWEYQVIKTPQPTAEQLDEPGGEGWELIAGAIDAHHGGVFVSLRKISN